MVGALTGHCLSARLSHPGPVLFFGSQWETMKVRSINGVEHKDIEWVEGRWLLPCVLCARPHQLLWLS